MKARSSRLLVRIGLLAASLLLAVLIAEALLQAGALIVQATSRRAPVSFLTTDRRLVCLGDSNTYGLYVEREEAYPQRLEQHWNRSGPTAPIEVLNLGYPGTNSSVVTREFPRILRDLSPDGVIVLIGANDFWTAQVEQAPEDGLLEGAIAWLRTRSRLYRIVAMLRAGDQRETVEATPFTPDPSVPRRVGTVRYGEHAFRLGFEGRKGWTPTDETKLVENLEALVEQARAADTELLLLTYPSDDDLYRFANQLIRRAAESTGAPLIDLSAAFDRSCPDEACERLFFADRHPTPLGYELIAKTIAEGAPDLLER